MFLANMRLTKTFVAIFAFDVRLPTLPPWLLLRIIWRKKLPPCVLTQVSRECEGGTSLAGWLRLGDSSYKRYIGKKLGENKFTNKSKSICFDTSFTCEGGTSLAGWLSVGDARKVDWSHERRVEADHAIGVMH